MTDEAQDSTWVDQADEPDFPAAVIEAASAGQSTLGPKLAELRDVRQPFPNGLAPSAADRWIADGGERPRTPSKPDGSEDDRDG